MSSSTNCQILSDRLLYGLQRAEHATSPASPGFEP
jgi:hypothetical protein